MIRFCPLFSSQFSPGEALRWITILVKHANLNCKCYGSGGLGFSKKGKTSQMMGRPHTGWQMRSCTLVQTYIIYCTCIYLKNEKGEIHVISIFVMFIFDNLSIDSALLLGITNSCLLSIGNVWEALETQTVLWT